MTVVDALMAIMLLGVALVSLVGTLDFSRDLTSKSELQEAASHRAQRELEKIQRLDFSAVAHPADTNFGEATDPDDPTSRIVGGVEPRFKFDRDAGSTSEPLVTSAGGGVALGPSSWSDGRFSGTVHRFITATNDALCNSAGGTASCPASRNYKRATVVVTIHGFDDPLKPVWFSSIVTDPRDGPVDASTSPVTECLDDNGLLATCDNAVDATVRSFFLTDTPATHATRQAIAGSHPTHPTVAPFGTCTAEVTTGCPVPDLLDDDSLEGSEVDPPLYKYSTDVSGGYSGGRALRRDVNCGGTPSATDNTKGGRWISAPLGSSATLTGQGGLTLHAHSIDGVDAEVTLCLGVYDVSGSIGNLVASPPTEIGRASFTLAHWPDTTDRVSFPLEFRADDVTIAAGRRIGLRLWVASSSQADIALRYDHTSFPAYVQLNEAG